MEQYIPKSAVIAEINKRLHQLTDAAFDSMIGRNLIEIRDSLDTLEVKEVDSNDDFIEKAQSFFRQSHYLFRLDSMDLYNFVEDFRNYMKGH